MISLLSGKNGSNGRNLEARSKWLLAQLFELSLLMWNLHIILQQDLGMAASTLG